MQNVLRHCNSLGSKAGVLYFCDILESSKSINTNELRKICSLNNEIRLNFDATVAFFDFLGLIHVEHYSNTINAFELSKKLGGEDKSKELCKCCLEMCLSNKKIDTSNIHFDVSEKCFYLGKYSFSVSDAVFRNFLISFGALIESSGRLYISEQYAALFSTAKRKSCREVTLEQLKERLLLEEEQGALAETFILQRELSRISNAELKKQIKQVSLLDVTAGYDIASFSGNSSKEYDLFIEVKSFSGLPHFYWSSNEMEVAKILKEKYVIALVDIKRIDDEMYEPELIIDPANTIGEDLNWSMTPSSFYVVRND